MTTHHELQLESTYIRLRPNARVETLAVDNGFWPKLMRGELGDFHHEYLVTMHSYEGNWNQWEMHPHGDEIVCLISGSVNFILERPSNKIVSLSNPGSYVVVPIGTWHTADVLQPSSIIFMTAGEGTQHRKR